MVTIPEQIAPTTHTESLLLIFDSCSLAFIAGGIQRSIVWIKRLMEEISTAPIQISFFPYFKINFSTIVSAIVILSMAVFDGFQCIVMAKGHPSMMSAKYVVGLFDWEGRLRAI